MTFSITLVIIALTCLISFMAFNRRDQYFKMMYNPYAVSYRREWHRIITHAFIHADFIHLLFNMYMLWMFGGAVEELFSDPSLFDSLGRLVFLILYLGGIIFAAIPAMIRHRNNDLYNSVGASGAVSAVLFSFIVIMPTAKLSPLFIPIGIPAWILGILYIGFEIYLDKRSKSNIAHDAHYWGALFGVIFTIALKPGLVMNFISQIFG